MMHLFLRLSRIFVFNELLALHSGFLQGPNPLYSPHSLQKGRIFDEFLVMLVHQ